MKNIQYFTQQDPLRYACMEDFYKRGAIIEHIDDDTLILYNKDIDIVYHAGKAIDHPIFHTCNLIMTDSKELSDLLTSQKVCTSSFPVYTCLYNDIAPNFVVRPGVTTNFLTEEHLPFVLEHYDNPGNTYDHIKGRIEEGMIGLFKEDELIGFIGVHEEGTMGFLFILEEHRHKGYAYMLESNLIRHLRNTNHIPYCHVFVENKASLKLQEKLNLIQVEKPYYWLGKDA